jgi:rhamnosyltransferase
MINKIYIIIVLYYPKDKQIDALIDLCKIYESIIIDNTPDVENKKIKVNIERNIINKAVYIPLKKNNGIAVAQNIGINEAKKRAAKFILFLDQDSVISHSAIQLLLSEYKKICVLNLKISAIGPIHRNKDTDVLYKTYEDNFNGYTAAKTLISSGMLTSIQVLDDIGFMDETLFIDYVDFEWCWRSQKKGYTCFRAKNAIMNHRLGLESKKIFNYTVIISTPIRYYYQYRNYLFLCRRKYVPRDWKLKEGIKKLFLILYVPLNSNKPLSVLMNMIKGIFDGIKGQELVA